MRIDLEWSTSVEWQNSNKKIPAQAGENQGNPPPWPAELALAGAD